jgi:glutathione S-transferase
MLIGAGAALAVAVSTFFLKKKKKKATPKKISVKYFGMPATPGEKLRLALCLTVGKDNFTDDRVVFGTWKDMKPTVKYQQLPVLYLDDVEYHQSGAALRYIGGNLGDGSMYPLDDAEMLLKIEEMIGVLDDLQRSWMPALYISMRPASMGYAGISDEDKTAKAKEMREAFLANDLPKYMGFLTAALEAGGNQVLCGETLTIADCQCLPQLHYFTRGVADFVPADCLDKYTVVVEYLTRVKAVPAIKEWNDAQTAAAAKK